MIIEVRLALGWSKAVPKKIKSNITIAFIFCKSKIYLRIKRQTIYYATNPITHTKYG